jgi:hypothetical protein
MVEFMTPWEAVPLAYVDALEPCETCGRVTRSTEYAPPETRHGLYDLRYHCECGRTWIVTVQVKLRVGDTVVQEYEPDHFAIEEILPHGRRTLCLGCCAARAELRVAPARSPDR